MHQRTIQVMPSASQMQEGALPKPARGEPAQFNALLKKNLSLQGRQKKTNCCQLLFPVVMLCMVAVFQLILDSLLASSDTSNTALRYPVHLNEYTGNGTNLIFGYNSNFTYTNPNSIASLGSASNDPSIARSGFLSNMPVSLSNTQQITASGIIFPGGNRVPYFNLTSSAAVADSMLSVEIGYHRQGRRNLQAAGQTVPVWPITSGSFDFKTVNTNSNGASLAVDIQYNNVSTSWPCVLFLGTRNTWPCTYWGNFSAASQLNMITNAFSKATYNVPIDATVTAMPMIPKSTFQRVVEILAGLFVPVTLTFLLPVFVYNIVLEKEERLREMMRMMGMKIWAYWTNQFLFHYVLYIAVAIVFLIMGTIFKLKLFIETELSVLVVLLLGWGLSLNSFSIFLSSFLNKATTARVISYVLVLITWIAGVVIESIVISGPPSPAYMLYPPWAFYHGIFAGLSACGNGRCLKMADVKPGTEMYRSLVYVWLESILYLALGLYFDAVLPREFGIPEKPLFFIQPVVDWWRRRKAGQNDIELGVISHDVRAAAIADTHTHIDEDVKAEEEAVENGLTPNAMIVIDNMRKVYDNGKVALKKISLAIDENQIFGLLGQNGAGKTTTISLLSGLYAPSMGTARVGGFDIRTDIHKVHLTLGMCPQFDILWGELTCREHLLFYCRLKGILNETAHVNDFLQRVGLLADADKLVSALSGGMKRRLSIAMALVGDPKVVFLDEPTTGLDPETRRHLWDLIIRSKPGRAIILTTHSMEEADVLSDRIGIMHLGRMRCIGNQTRLKTLYGMGFKLSLSYDEADRELAHRCVKEIAGDAAVLSSTFMGSCSFQISPNSVKVSTIFTEMQLRKAQYGIRDFGVSQTSLEDVFLKIATNNHGDSLNVFEAPASFWRNVSDFFKSCKV